MKPAHRASFKMKPGGRASFLIMDIRTEKNNKRSTCFSESCLDFTSGKSVDVGGGKSFI